MLIIRNAYYVWSVSKAYEEKHAAIPTVEVAVCCSVRAPVGQEL